MQGHLNRLRLLLALLIPVATFDLACERANPAYHPDAAALDATAGTGGGGGGPGTGGSPAGTGGTDVADAGGGDATLDGNPVACTGDGDNDGYGTGAGCAGLDCDDTDPAIGPTAERGCYGGDPTTRGGGICRDGTQTCTAGLWSSCNGQVLPAAEGCNGEDDDCDGIPDDALPRVTCGLGACQKSVPSCSNGVAAACVATAPATDSDGCPANGIDDDCDGA